jgi:hypothetical protein
MSDSGAVLFARYAYPPNELGYCGPAGAAALLDACAPAEIARRARGFEGAWVYLEFLARAAGVADPLDPAVVSAYWVGNELLSAGTPSSLLSYLGPRFAGQYGGTWMSAGERAVAHHSFHVFEVYPWAAMLRRTGNPAAVSVLDRCRIRTGVVVSVADSAAIVTSCPLRWDGARLSAGEPREERVSWSASLLPSLSPGDRVALHWDWLCDVITQEQETTIQLYEERQLTLLPA